MNRFLLLAWAAFVLAAVAAPKPVALVNAGFETGSAERADGWSRSPAYRLSPGNGMNGSGALEFGLAEPMTNFLPAVVQKIKLSPGMVYRVSCRARCENVVKHPGNPRGVAIGVEWYDGEGRAHGAYSHDLTGTHDWTALAFETPRMPRDVVRAHVQVYVGYGSTTGKAWFDEVLIEPIEQPPVGTLVVGAYRGVASEGTVDFVAALAGEVEDFAAAGYAVELRYRDHAGKAVRRRDAVEFSVGMARFRVPVHEFAIGAQLVGLALVDSAGRDVGLSETTFTRALTPMKRRVCFDRLNRTLVDGRPFFPLGMYCGSPEESEMSVYREGPFNCVMPYNEPTAAQLDWLHGHGLMVIYPLKEVFAGRAWAKARGILTDQDEIAYITQRVNAVKDHPAVLAWYLNDELGPDFVPRLTMHQRLFERLDADHPTWNLLYQVAQLDRYLTCFDVIGTDPYPIPGNPLGMAAKWATETRDCSFGMRPVWQVPQAMDWSWFPGGKHRKGCHMPTCEELRSMTWQSIAGGANGLVFYAFHQMRRNLKGERFAAAWADVKAVASEVKQYEHILLAGDPPPAFTSSVPEMSLPMRLFKEGGHTWLVAAGAAQSPVNATVKLPVAVGKAHKLFGNGNVQVKDGVIVIDMPVYGTLIVEL